MGDEIFEEFKAASSNFTKAFYVLIGFTLIFLFLILIPYFSAEQERQSVSKGLDEIQMNSTWVEKRVNAIGEIGNGLRPLRLLIAMPPEYRLNYTDFIAKQTQNGTQYADTCTIDYQLETGPWVLCKLRLINHFDRSTAELILTERIDKPFSELDVDKRLEQYSINGIINIRSINVTKDPDLVLYVRVAPDQLRADIRTLYDQYNAIIERNPTLWRSNDTRQRVLNEINSTTIDFLRNHESLNLLDVHITDLQKDLRSALITLNETRNKLEQEIVKIEQEQADISSRVEDVEFPFGRIPVSLKDAIVLFPIALAGGFLSVTQLHVRALKLRKKHHEQKLKEECDQNKKFDIEKLSLVAHLWLDPHDNYFVRGGKAATLLLIPLGGFITSVVVIDYLVSSSPTFAEALGLGVKEVFTPIIYPILFVLYAYGIVDLWHNYRKYKKYYREACRCPEKDDRDQTITQV